MSALRADSRSSWALDNLDELSTVLDDAARVEAVTATLDDNRVVHLAAPLPGVPWADEFEPEPFVSLRAYGTPARDVPHALIWMAGLIATALFVGFSLARYFDGNHPAPVPVQFGSTVSFVRDPVQAAEQARTEGKLLMVITLSGDFEQSHFT